MRTNLGLAVVAAAALAAGAVAAPRPPVLVLSSAAGVQRGVQGSFCVSGEGSSICADGLQPHPRRVSVVRPGETLVLRAAGTKLSKPSAELLRLGCEAGSGRQLPARSRSGRWELVAPRQRGAYELQVFARFRGPAGSGDVSVGFGVLVDRSRQLRILPASRFAVCKDPYRPPPSVVHGGSARQRALLDRTIRKIGIHDFAGARIGAGRQLSLTMLASDRGRSTTSVWEALLAAGGFRDLSAARGLPRVRGLTISLIQNGRLRRFASCAVGRPHGTASTAEAKERVLRSVLRREGLHAVRIDAVAAAGPAYVVRARTDGPESFTRDLGARLARLRRAGRTSDGVLLEVRDPRTNLVVRYGHASRLGAALGWARPGLPNGGVIPLRGCARG